VKSFVTALSGIKSVTYTFVVPHIHAPNGRVIFLPQSVHRRIRHHADFVANIRPSLLSSQAQTGTDLLACQISAQILMSVAGDEKFHL
jgi:hypothetical protein